MDIILASIRFRVSILDRRAGEINRTPGDEMRDQLAEMRRHAETLMARIDQARADLDAIASDPARYGWQSEAVAA